LLKRKAQVRQDEDSVEPGKLFARVVSVTVQRVRAGRFEQAEPIVVAQRLD
jgi:hypothetical protein